MIMRQFLKTLIAASVWLAGSMAGQAAIQHRYSFDVDASDSVGTADGTLMGTTGSIVGGQVELPGGPINATNAYVSLPAAGIAINTYTQVTFHGWFRFDAVAGDFQKLFGFGGTQTTAGLEWAGKEYIICGVRSGGAGPCDAAISNGAEGDGDPWTEEANVVGPVLPVGNHHIAVVIDDTQISIFVEGVHVQTDLLTSSASLPSLDQVSNDLAYLGRSVYGDALLGGAIDEFRIYDTAQGQLEVGIMAGLGPDDASGDPGAEVSRNIVVDDTVIDGSKQAVLEVTYANAGLVAINSDPSLVWSSSDPAILSVSQDGIITGHTPGTVTLTATLNGTPTTTSANVGGTTLKHRYAFNGAVANTDTNNLSFTEPDLVGTADGTVWGPDANRLGDGTLELSASGTNDSATAYNETLRDNGYVDLPNGIISSLASMTLEAWVTPRSGSGGWERIFDAGTTTIGEVLPGNTTGYSGSGTDWFYLTAYRNQDPVISIRRDIVGQEVVPPGIGWYDTLTPTELHVVATYNTAAGVGSVYVNGKLKASGPLEGTLATFPDVNVWLGRSIWQGDANLNGLLNEFRIYEGVLSPREVAISAQLGADNPGGDPGAVSSRSIDSHDTIVVEGAKSLRLSVQYANLTGPVLFQTDTDLTWSSSDTNVLTVTDAGVMTGVSIGTATVTATFDGTDTTKLIEVTDRALKHRYTFNGDYSFDFDIPEPDIVGGADAVIREAYERNGAGQADLYWDYNSYVDLPNGIISPLGSGTFEAWLTPRELGNGWERAFDFGTGSFQDGSKPVSDQDGEVTDPALNAGFNGGEGLYVSYRMGTNPNLQFSAANGQAVIGNVAHAMGVPIHVVLSYNTAAQESILYLNGIPVGTDDAAPLLDQVRDVNNWLGRSNWSGDSRMDGLYDEFRIYEGVLTPFEIAVNTVSGPNGEPFADPGASVTAVTLTADPTSLIAETDGVQAYLFADFTNLSGVPANGLDGVAFYSEDTNIVTVSGTGFVDPVGAGTVTVWGEFMGQSNSVTFVVDAIVKPITLVHKWTFNEAPGSTIVVDSVGTADGIVIGTNHMFTGTSLDLFGGSSSANAGPTSTVAGVGSYVDLPNGIVSSLSDAATFEVWYTWDGQGAAWQRVMDFGIDAAHVENTVGTGAENLFITPNSGVTTIRAAVATNAPGYNFEFQFDGPEPIANEPVHVVFTWDSADNLGRMYVNGERVSSSTGIDFALSQIPDLNNWLGRAQYNDPMFNGKLHELCIYNGIMTTSEVAARYAIGPGEGPVEGPPIGSAVMTGSNLVLSWTEGAGQPAFGVQAAAAMMDGTNTVWAPSGLTPVETNGMKQVTVPLGADEAYYRLSD